MPGYVDRILTDDEISAITHSALADYEAKHPLAGKRVLVIIPDGTRTAPIPQMFRLLHRELSGRVGALDFLIALGTHRAMSPEQIDKLIGVTAQERETAFKGVNVFNHEWEKPETFVTLGTISADEVATTTGGMLREAVPVRINRKVCEYDHIIVCGPVFPHEVVGFSGGNKYFFPGVSGPELIH